MFSKLVSVLALASFVVAAPGYTDTSTTTNSNQCNSGYQYCCNSYTTYADSSSVWSSLPNNLVGVVAGLAGTTLGLGQGCSPLNVIAQSSGCSNSQLCCEGNTYNGGLIVLGCSPITA